MSKVVFDHDMGFEKLFTQFKGAKDTSVFIGVLRSSGVYEKSDGITVAQVAAIHEFGSKDGHIPERSFMRSSIDANKDELELMIKKLTVKITDGKITPNQALGLVGQFVKDKMVSKIISGPFKDLAKSTVARKGSEKPLIDTGQLKNSIDWEIRTKDKG